MSKPEKVGSIEIAQDVEFHEKTWRIQRIGWKAMLALAVAALLGAFGSGPLSSAETGASESGLTAKYERFARAGAEHDLELLVSPAAVRADSVVRIWMASDWLAGNKPLSISPQPSSETVLPDRVIYEFEVGEPASAVTIRFMLEAKKFGVRRWRGGVDGSENLSFTQVVYP